MDIITKPGRLKIDPKRPESDPRYAKAAAAAKRNFAKMKFENDAQKRDYLRSYSGNPHNLPGLPAFYPNLRIREFQNFSWYEDEEKQRQWRLRQLKIRDTELRCPTCERVTPHSISPEGSYCKKCGNHNIYRS